MKVEIKNKTDVQGILSVEISKEIIDQEKEKFANNFQKNAKVDGFRKGKSPISLVKNRFKDEIMSETINNLIQNKCTEALKKVNIKPLTIPKIQNINFNSDSSLFFEIDFETKPTISLCEFKNLKWEKEIVEVQEQEIEKNLLMLQDQFSTLQPVENQPVTKKNVIIADIQEIENKIPVVGKEWKNLWIEIGKNIFPEWLEEKIIGLNKDDEKDISFDPNEKASSSENLQQPILQEKEQKILPVTYRIKIKEIRKKILPNLDDEFAKKLKCESLDKLKEKIKIELTDYKEKISSNKLKDTVLDYFNDHIAFDLPESLVENELLRIKEIYQKYLKEKQVSEQEIIQQEEKNIEEMKKTAKKNVSIYFIINEFAEKNNIKITKEEFDKVIEQESIRLKKNKEDVIKMLKNDLSQLEQDMLFDKTIDFILSNGEIINIKKEKHDE
ncbi:MAG: trigger factor [bacterium]